MKNYAECIQKAAQKYHKTQFAVTKLAAEFVDLDEQNFEASFREAQAIPEMAKKLKEDEESVRMVCEPKRATPVSKELLKNVVMEKMKMEFEVEAKLANMRATSQQQAQGIVMLERTKVMDQIYLKHQVKLHEL